MDSTQAHKLARLLRPFRLSTGDKEPISPQFSMVTEAKMHRLGLYNASAREPYVAAMNYYDWYEGAEVIKGIGWVHVINRPKFDAWLKTQEVGRGR